MKKAKENLKKLEVSEKPISLRASDYYELSIRQPYKLGDLSLEVESAQMKLLPYSPPEFYGGHENVVLVRIQNKTSEDLVEISSAKGKNVGFFEGYAIQLDRILFYSQEDSKVQIRIQKLTLGKRIEVLAKIPYKIDELEITFLGGITKRLMNGGEELDAAFMLKKGRSEKKFHETIGAKPAEVIFEGYKVKLITGFWDYLHVIVEKTNKTAPKIESSGAVFLPYEPPQKAAKAETEAYNSSVGYGQDMNIGRTYKIGDIKITAKEAILDIMPAREGFKDNCVEYLTLEVSKGLAKKELKLTKMGQHDELSSAIFRDYTITLYSLTESHVSVKVDKFENGDWIGLIPGAEYKLYNLKVKIEEFKKEKVKGTESEMVLVSLANTENSAAARVYLRSFTSSADYRLWSDIYFEGYVIHFSGGADSPERYFGIKKFESGNDIVLYRGDVNKVGNLTVVVTEIAKDDKSIKILLSKGKAKKELSMELNKPVSFEDCKITYLESNKENAMLKVEKG